jgi:hypothetical protein
MQPNILIVDDDPSTIRLLGQIGLAFARPDSGH